LGVSLFNPSPWAPFTDSRPVPTIPANPTLQDLEAARPDHGKQLQKGRETKDYYFKFVAATKKHSAEQIGEVYNMAKSTMRQEINRAKRVVESLLDVEKIEARSWNSSTFHLLYCSQDRRFTRTSGHVL
jgi:hypothetical protein